MPPGRADARSLKRGDEVGAQEAPVGLPRFGSERVREMLREN